VGLFPVNIACIRESLESLADEIEFVASGDADDPSDSEAWEHRVNGGRQVVRLRAALNNGDLDRADCRLDTIPVLRDVRREVMRLQYGSHHDQSNQYCGPLHLPGEIQPLFPVSPESLLVRKAGEPYDEPLWSTLSDDARSAILAAAEQATSDSLANRALRSLSKPPQTTKRERWTGLPNVLRTLSAKLASPPATEPATKGQGDEAADDRRSAALDRNNVAVLFCLSNREPALQTLDDIVVSAKVSRDTASKALKELIDGGLASRPKGERKGATVTDKGQTMAAQIRR
jgi:predicted transcriptional regulator